MQKKSKTVVKRWKRNISEALYIVLYANCAYNSSRKKLNEVKWKMSNNLFENEVISKSGIDNSRLKRKPTSEKCWIFIPTNIYLGMTPKYYMLNCFFETELIPKCYGRTDGQADRWTEDSHDKHWFCLICSRFNTYAIETKTIPKKCEPLVCRKMLNAGYEMAIGS